MSIKHITNWLGQLFFPPICRACGERQRIFTPRPTKVLCPSCYKKWQAERASTCADCGFSSDACHCIPVELKREGIKAFVHLTPYRPGKPGAASAMILRGKDNCDWDMFRFLAQELSDPVCIALGEEQKAVVTYVPRRLAAVKAIGHDHAKQIARYLADELSLPWVSAIRRRPMTRQQKELSAVEREKNAAKSFEMVNGEDVRGKTVILLDDICTTGASLASCADLVLSAGAKEAICVVIARTEHQNKQ